MSSMSLAAAATVTTVTTQIDLSSTALPNRDSPDHAVYTLPKVTTGTSSEYRNRLADIMARACLTDPLTVLLSQERFHTGMGRNSTYTTTHLLG